MGKIILVSVEPSCLELLSKQCSVLMLPLPRRVPTPPSDTHWGMVVGGAVHRLRLQSYPVLWPAGHIATNVGKRREGQGRQGLGQDTSSHDSLTHGKLDGICSLSK